MMQITTVVTEVMKLTAKKDLAARGSYVRADNASRCPTGATAMKIVLTALMRETAMITTPAVRESSTAPIIAASTAITNVTAITTAAMAAMRLTVTKPVPAVMASGNAITANVFETVSNVTAITIAAITVMKETAPAETSSSRAITATA